MLIVVLEELSADEWTEGGSSCLNKLGEQQWQTDRDEQTKWATNKQTGQWYLLGDWSKQSCCFVFCVHLSCSALILLKETLLLLPRAFFHMHGNQSSEKTVNNNHNTFLIVNHSSLLLILLFLFLFSNLLISAQEVKLCMYACTCRIVCTSPINYAPRYGVQIWWSPFPYAQIPYTWIGFQLKISLWVRKGYWVLGDTAYFLSCLPG